MNGGGACWVAKRNNLPGSSAPSVTPSAVPSVISAIANDPMTTVVLVCEALTGFAASAPLYRLATTGAEVEG